METEFCGTCDVVSLTNFRRAMAYNPIAEVEAYWEALRGVRVVPLRSEIDPRGIERALDNTFLLERIAPGLARFRLAGQELNALLGMEVRGMPLTACIAPASRERMREILGYLFEGPKVVRLDLASKGALGRPGLSARMVLLPLKSDLGDISRAIGCISVDGRIGKAPRRFDITSESFVELGPFQNDQPHPTPGRQSDDQHGFSEDAAVFEPRTPVPAHKPHLRLVKSDDGK